MKSGNGIVPASGRRPNMIKGLVPSLPERGKIKIGIKGATIRSRRGVDFQPPQKLDHFVVTTLERGKDGNFLPDAALMERLGDKPTEIPVRLLYDDPTLNFPTRLACFVGRTLWCAGDGETATRLTELPAQVEGDRVELKPHQVSCPCHRQDPAYTGRDKCKMNGALNVLIDGAGGLGGVWKFRTTSYNSIVGILSSLAFLRNITGGVLANIPLKLQIQPKQATSPTDGGQLTIYVVNLTFDGETEQLQEIGHQIALRRATTHVSIEHIEDEARRALALMPPSNVALPGDDTDDVIEEFYPEQVNVPEPERAPGDGRALHQEEEQLEPEFAVVDNDGNEFDFGRERAIKAINAIFTDAGRYDMARLQGAWESNKVTIERLTQEGAGAEAAALTAYYNELRDLMPVPARTAGPQGREAAAGPTDTPVAEPPAQRPAARPVSPAQDLPADRPRAADMFPGDLPAGERLVPRGVGAPVPVDPDHVTPPPRPRREPPGPPKDSYLIEPVLRAGKVDWRTWVNVKFLPQLRQETHYLEFFLGDNTENKEKAEAVLSPAERKDLQAAIDAQWAAIKKLDEDPA
jgi:hypothetical protein